jgi:hypothetical protein
MKQSIEQLAAEERREYFRQWRAANKDKVKRHNQAYWQRRAEKKLKEQGE